MGSSKLIYCKRNTVTIGRDVIFFSLGFMFCYFYVFPNYKCFPLTSQKIWKNGTDDQNFISTCNWESDQRGANQKVISYSIYGNLSNEVLAKRYLECFKVTLNKIPIAFPGWVVRIYNNVDSSDTVGWKVLQDSLPVKRDFIDLCNATEIIKRRKLGNLFPMTWRFLPMLDDLVDIMMSRDSDSQILSREEDAVREWLESNRTFHNMKDNPKHCSPPILGGLWGAKINQNRIKLASVFTEIMSMNHNQNRDYDQTLLTNHVWPIAKTDMMLHDSYCCENSKNISQPFLKPREGQTFVGLIQPEGCQPNTTFKYNIQECPKLCRPNNTLFDWRYC